MKGVECRTASCLNSVNFIFNLVKSGALPNTGSADRVPAVRVTIGYSDSVSHIMKYLRVECKLVTVTTILAVPKGFTVTANHCSGKTQL